MTKEKHGIRFSILDLGKMQCDQKLVVAVMPPEAG